MSQLEIRSQTGEISLNEGNTIVGYAAVYDSPSVPIPLNGVQFREIIRKGTFDDAVKSGREIFALAYHDENRVLGSTVAKTLRLTPDDKGLRFELELPDTTDGRDIRESVRRGDIRGASLGFKARQQKWSRQNGVVVRELLAADLGEITITPKPAYPQTSLSLRSFENFLEEERKSQLEILRLKARLLKLR